jgi:alpha-glucuronidase
MGTIPCLNKTFGLDLPGQKAEGFVIRLQDQGAMIAGQDPVGTLYGVYRFLSLLALGKTLLQNIYDTRFEGCDEVTALRDAWASLKDKIDEDCYAGVLARFEKQLVNAR